jgi:hypothetical protein
VAERPAVNTSPLIFLTKGGVLELFMPPFRKSDRTPERNRKKCDRLGFRNRVFAQDLGSEVKAI